MLGEDCLLYLRGLAVGQMRVYKKSLTMFRLDGEEHFAPLPLHSAVTHLLVMYAPVAAFQDRVSEARFYGVLVAVGVEAIAIEF